MTDNNNRNTLKEAFDAELMKRLEENPPEIPTYEEFSAMVDKSLAERCRRRSRIAGIAAGFVVVLLVSILACTNLTKDVDADKNPKEEIITEDGVIIEDGGWGSSEYEDNIWMTEDWDEVADAKEIYPQLIIPKYIPKDYTFDNLVIEAYATGDLMFEYVFYNNADIKLEVEGFIIQNGAVSSEIKNVSRRINSRNGTVYLQESEKKATIYINDGTSISIWHTLTDEELLKVINEMDFKTHQ